MVKQGTGHFQNFYRLSDYSAILIVLKKKQVTLKISTAFQITETFLWLSDKELVTFKISIGLQITETFLWWSDKELVTFKNFYHLTDYSAILKVVKQGTSHFQKFLPPYRLQRHF